MKKAVCLLSGGLDSTTSLAIAQSEGYEVTALIFNYGQRHNKEIERAKDIANHYGVKYIIANIDLREWGGSALTDDIDVPEERKVNQMQEEIPITYVPGRNTIFLSFALSLAEVNEAEAIFTGMNYIDYSGYPDCRPEFIKAFNELIKVAVKATSQDNKSIEILAPLLYLGKRDIIQKGLELGVPYEKTWSCYNGLEEPCHKCDSCILREQGFKELGMEDPLCIK